MANVNLADTSAQRVGRSDVVFSNTIARTDTSAKNLFTLPAGAVPISISYSSPAPSNAGTTATISVGKSGGTGTEFLAATDVKTAGTGGGSQNPTSSASTQFGAALAADTVVTGTYAETGTASSSGGPWLVSITCLVQD